MDVKLKHIYCIVTLCHYMKLIAFMHLVGFKKQSSIFFGNNRYNYHTFFKISANVFEENPSITIILGSSLILVHNSKKKTFFT